MNTYKKYCPNVFVAQCTEEHEQGEEIILTTKYGKEHECIVHNFVGYTGTKENPLFLYSITRADGFNAQERAKAKAERIRGYQANAEKRSNEYYKKADGRESATGIPFGQPILVGHHSERKHRKVIEGLHRNMDKSVEESNKAESYESRAEYWESKANDINLSMPESLGYYEFELEKAKKAHQFYIDNPDKREHSFSLTYAKKAVNDLTKKLHLAVKLWGSAEEIQQLNDEKAEESKSKLSKKSNFDNLLKKYGGFFFFGLDAKAFKEKHTKLVEQGYIEEGENVTHIIAGLHVPVKHKDAFIKEL